MIINAAPRTLTQELTVAFRLITAGALVMLATVAAATCWFVAVLMPRAEHASHLGTTAEAAEQSLQQEQSALRAFILTGDQAVLASYRLGRERLAVQSQELAGASSRPIRQAERRFAALTDDWTRSWVRRALDPTRSEVTTRRGDIDAARLAAFVDEGSSSYQAAADAQQELAAAVSAHRAAIRGQSLAVLSAALLIVLVTGGGVIGWTVRRRQRLQRQIVGPIQSLLATLRAVGRGEFGRNPARVGPAELVELRDEMVDMSASLQLQQRALAIRAEQAANAAARLGHVVEFVRAVSCSLTLTPVLEAFSDSCRRLLCTPQARIWLIDPDGRTLRLAHDSELRGGIVPVSVQPVGAAGVGRAAHERRPCYSRGLTGQPSADGAPVALAFPLLKGPAVVGVVEVPLTYETHRLRADTVEVLDAISGHAAMAIDAALLYGRVESLSLSDPLTGLANRRRFDQEINLEVERSRRSGQALTVLMVDIDHFKDVNDTLGHSTGDAVIRQIGGTLDGQMRAGDTAYRVGGEEFAVLLRDTDHIGAAVVAERLRALVQQQYTPGGGPHVTVSVGLATLPHHATSVTDLVDAADTAMYGAKRAGRNRVVISDSSIPAQRGAPANAAVAALPSSRA